LAERKTRTGASVKSGVRKEWLMGATCNVTGCGFEVTVTSTGQQDILPPAGFCCAGTLPVE
jgi:hypothetical protein